MRAAEMPDVWVISDVTGTASFSLFPAKQLQFPYLTSSLLTRFCALSRVSEGLNFVTNGLVS